MHYHSPPNPVPQPPAPFRCGGILAGFSAQASTKPPHRSQYPLPQVPCTYNYICTTYSTTHWEVYLTHTFIAPLNQFDPNVNFFPPVRSSSPVSACWCESAHHLFNLCFFSPFHSSAFNKHARSPSLFPHETDKRYPVDWLQSTRRFPFAALSWGPTIFSTLSPHCIADAR